MATSLSKSDILALFDEIKTEQALSFPLSEAFLKRYFKQAVFEKAKTYLSSDQILWCETSDDFSAINAEVVNSNGDIFYPQATITKLDSKITVNASCSCRLGKKCEHLAAVFLSLKTKHSGSFGKNYLLHDWFKQLEHIKSRAHKNAKNVLLFCLDSYQNDIVITPKIAPYSPSGEYGLGRSLTAKQASSSVTPLDLDEKDFRLFSWIRSQNSLSKLMLTNEWGALALAKLVETKRCYWGSERQALSLVHKEKLDLHWQKEEKEASLKLHINEHNNWVLVPTTPPFFIDLEHKQVGELDTSLSSQEVIHLLNMPTVEKEIYDSTQDRLSSFYGNGFVPALCDVTHANSGNPIPCIALIDGQDSPYLSLHFDYGSKAKNYAFENTCINQLKNYGLELVEGNDPGHTFLAFSASSENPAQWHWFIEEITSELVNQGWRTDIGKGLLSRVKTTKLKVLLNRLPNNKLQMEAHLTFDNQMLEFGMMRESAALINNKANKHLYINSTGDQWLAVSREQALSLKYVVDQYYGDKKWPKRFSFPLSALSLLRAVSSELLEFKQDELEALYYLEKDSVYANAALPSALNASLRDYQVKGLGWLQFLHKHGLGGILADDMGLGKTIQVLSFLLWQKEQGQLSQPTLIICPTSLVSNWVNECNKFTPDLSVSILHGANRHQLFDKAHFADIVITSFPLLLRDEELYLSHRYSNIVLDEAQTIKNTQAKVSRIAKSLNGDFKLCLSGTPVENNLAELKSLLDFSMPGLLGSAASFKEYYRIPIEKEHHIGRAEQLTNIISGYVLRRTKQQVATELPAKTEMTKLVELTAEQKSLYGEISEQLEQKVKNIFAEGQSQGSKLAFLDALLKLRQICCDPRLTEQGQDYRAKHSAKLMYLLKTLPEMLAEGRKIIIFSQFTSMLRLIEVGLQDLGIKHSVLTGQTKNRESVVNEFQSGETSIFLISLKAGGTGLNLTAADTVIHYDPWWNPAVERQATDRAYRIGQDKPVFVYKLICQDSIEEKVQRMQFEKAALADTFFDNSTSRFSDISEQDLLSLIGA